MIISPWQQTLNPLLIFWLLRSFKIHTFLKIFFFVFAVKSVWFRKHLVQSPRNFWQNIPLSKTRLHFKIWKFGVAWFQQRPGWLVGILFNFFVEASISTTCMIFFNNSRNMLTKRTFNKETSSCVLKLALKWLYVN